METPFSSSSNIGDTEKKPYCLFVVDDDEFVRTSLARRLRREGFEVQEFTSGEAVVAYLEEKSGLPDVVITDFKMPGLNGVETTNRIHQLASSIPVILLTAYSGAIEKEEAECSGIFKILTKTIDLETLPEVIHQAIQRQHP